MNSKEKFHAVKIRENRGFTVIVEEENIETYEDAVKYVREQYGEGEYDNAFSVSVSAVEYIGIYTRKEYEDSGEHVVIYGEDE